MISYHVVLIGLLTLVFSYLLDDNFEKKNPINKFYTL